MGRPRRWIIPDAIQKTEFSWLRIRGPQTFRNGLARVDWSKYWSYANRVRQVRLADKSQGRKVQINPQALFHALAATTGQIGHGAILPKAKRLQFDFQRPTGPAMMLSLISPAVRCIAVTIPQASEQMSQAASIVFSTLTSMSSTLKLEQFDIAVGDDVSSSMSWRQDARRTLDSNIVAFIASQLELQRLRIHPIDSSSSLKEAISPLTALRTLDVTCKTSLSNPQLEDTIRSIASCIELEQLQLQGPSSNKQHTFSLIQPLLPCRRLLNLDISWFGPITLDAANVEEMGKAWAKLESLQFSLIGDAMPVDLLLTFAASFSSLRSLVVPLDVSKADNLSPLTTEVPTHNLKQLFPGSSIKETHIQPFAELLSTIFRPGLRIFSGSGPGEPNGSTESSRHCDQVNNLLSLIWRAEDRARRRLKNELGAGVQV